MTPSIKLVIFDMAGTTVDEDNVVYKTVRAAINAAGYQFSQNQVQEAGAGKEKSQAIRDVLALDGNSHPDDEVATIFADFKQRLAAAYETLDVKEQPGASVTFAKLATSSSARASIRSAKFSRNAANRSPGQPRISREAAAEAAIACSTSSHGLTG